MSADVDADQKLEDYQDALRSGDHEQTGFGSPEHGQVVELLMCDYLGLEYVDAEAADARTDDGTMVQIKACQREHENGDGTVPGRWDAWSDSLLSLLYADGQYLLVVYDGESDAAEATVEDLDDYVLAWRFLGAEDFGELIGPDAWHDGGRPSKGNRARVFWTDVFDGVDA